MRRPFIVKSGSFFALISVDDEGYENNHEAMLYEAAARFIEHCNKSLEQSKNTEAGFGVIMSIQEPGKEEFFLKTAVAIKNAGLDKHYREDPEEGDEWKGPQEI